MRSPMLGRGFSLTSTELYFVNIELPGVESSFAWIRFVARLADCIAAWSIFSCLVLPACVTLPGSFLIASWEGRAGVLVELRPCAIHPLCTFGLISTTLRCPEYPRGLPSSYLDHWA